jgi:hypothetical protein
MILYRLGSLPMNYYMLNRLKLQEETKKPVLYQGAE